MFRIFQHFSGSAKSYQIWHDFFFPFAFYLKFLAFMFFEKNDSVTFSNCDVIHTYMDIPHTVYHLYICFYILCANWVLYFLKLFDRVRKVKNYTKIHMYEYIKFNSIYTLMYVCMYVHMYIVSYTYIYKHVLNFLNDCNYVILSPNPFLWTLMQVTYLHINICTYTYTTLATYVHKCFIPHCTKNTIILTQTIINTIIILNIN